MENDEPETDKTVQIVKDTNNNQGIRRYDSILCLHVRMTLINFFFYSSAQLYQNFTNTHHRSYHHHPPLRPVAAPFILLTTIILVTHRTAITVMIPQIITIEAENRGLTHNSYRRLGRKILPKDVVLLRFNGTEIIF